jgi:hypothetical protein
MKRRFTILFGFAILATGVLAAESRLWVVEEPREGLFQDADAFARVGPDTWLQHGARSYVAALESFHDQLATVPDGRPPRMFYFFCTVYFTPRESGFAPGRGFDRTPDTRSAFGGRTYPKSFLKAVVMEGFGRIDEPVGGKHYMKYDGNWGYGAVPLGNRNNPLHPRLSAAVHRSNPLFRRGTRFFILDPEIYNVMGSMEWEAADTGGGLFRSQIDLYWGEDDPRGPWPETALAAGCPLSVQWIVPVVFP